MERNEDPTIFFFIIFSDSIVFFLTRCKAKRKIPFCSVSNRQFEGRIDAFIDFQELSTPIPYFSVLLLIIILKFKYAFKKYPQDIIILSIFKPVILLPKRSTYNESYIHWINNSSMDLTHWPISGFRPTSLIRIKMFDNFRFTRDRYIPLLKTSVRNLTQIPDFTIQVDIRDATFISTNCFLDSQLSYVSLTFTSADPIFCLRTRKTNRHVY